MPDPASFAGFAIRDEGAVRHIVLNRPEARNALNRDMRENFSKILTEAEADRAIGAVVLSGAGGVFSAGVDLKDKPKNARPVEPNPALCLRRFRKPLLAAVDGPCVTGALEMILSCDFAIASPSAVFADTHCRVGLFPRWGGGELLFSAIGARRARQMVLTGKFISADIAFQWGLINEIVAEDRLIARANALACAMIESADKEPLSFRLHGDMLDEMAAHDAEKAIEAAKLALFDAGQIERQRSRPAGAGNAQSL